MNPNFLKRVIEIGHNTSTIGKHDNQSSLNRMKNYKLISANNFTPTNLEKGCEKFHQECLKIMVY